MQIIKPKIFRNLQKFMRQVHLIPILSDNYSYLIVDSKTKQAAIVDPAEPKKIAEAIKDFDLKLTKVLTTHKHWDHAGGNEEMAKLFPGIEIVGPKNEPIPALTTPVQENDVIKIGNLEGYVLDSPCHTKGHVLYVIKSSTKDEPDALFCGDTLFLGGCGRFFEGDAQMMYRALKKISALDPKTLVYCGHEYSINNLKFALTIEPNNKATLAKLEECQKLRKEGKPTIPSTVEEELSYNPFMRTDEKSVQIAVAKSDPIEALAEIRRRKDSF